MGFLSKNVFAYNILSNTFVIYVPENFLRSSLKVCDIYYFFVTILMFSVCCDKYSRE